MPPAWAGGRCQTQPGYAGMNARQILFKARLGKPALDQPRLLFSQHIGRHVEIPSVSEPFEAQPGEGEE
jgi:hypothetical protein